MGTDPADTTSTRPSGARWWRAISRAGWFALAAAAAGWLFEVFDVALISLTVTALSHDFHTTKAAVGSVVTIQVLGMVTGGILGGWLADRFGRARALTVAVAVYAVFTGLAGAATSLAEMGALRLVAGLGMGATWSAGAALVAETWPAEHRAKGGALMQAGLPAGNVLAVGVAALVTHLHGGLTDGGWRWLFAVGALPLLLAAFTWTAVPESPTWRRGRCGGTTRRPGLRALLADGHWQPLLAALGFLFFVQYLYWAITTFLPSFLAEVDRLGFTASTGYLLLQQAGSVAGFAVFAWLADRWGRRPTFVLYLLAAAAATILLITTTRHAWVLLGTFLAGVGVSGVFAGVGPWAAEMTHRSPVRALAMGTAYNGGRLGGALAPLLVGALATSTTGFRFGLGTALVAAALGITIMLATRETRGRQLAA